MCERRNQSVAVHPLNSQNDDDKKVCDTRKVQREPFTLFLLFFFTRSGGEGGGELRKIQIVTWLVKPVDRNVVVTTVACLPACRIYGGKFSGFHT